MPKPLRPLAIAIVAGAAILATSALAEPPGEADRASIQMMIRDQIAAFLQDDGEAAFAFASPTIRSLFQTSERFMVMVERGYPAVYRAQQVAFGEIVEIGGSLLQQVFLVGPKGNSWVAAYAVQQQPDGTWRINGVQITRDPGTAI